MAGFEAFFTLLSIIVPRRAKAFIADQNLLCQYSKKDESK
jgi:hypothetical protein